MHIAKITGLLVALVLVVAACSGGGGGEAPGTPDPPEPDPEPTLEITASPADVAQGDIGVLSVSLKHADIADATLAWTAASGEFSDATATNPVWVAPEESGSATINLELSADGLALTDSVEVTAGTDVVGWCESAGDMNNPADPCVIYTVAQLQDIGSAVPGSTRTSEPFTGTFRGMDTRCAGLPSTEWVNHTRRSSLSLRTAPRSRA